MLLIERAPVAVPLCGAKPRSWSHEAAFMVARSRVHGRSKARSWSHEATFMVARRRRWPYSGAGEGAGERGIEFEALDNGILSCADPVAMRRFAQGLTANESTALCYVAGAPAAFLHDWRPGGGHPLRHLRTASEVRPHPGLRPPRSRTGLLRGGHAREPRLGPSRPCAVDLRQTRHQTHPLAVSNPRCCRGRSPFVARGLQALAHRSRRVASDAFHKEGRALPMW